MGLIIEPARVGDVDELLKLYFMIYGPTYPLPFGTDRRTAIETIVSPENKWIVARDTETKRIAGSVVYVIDAQNRIGKVTGLVVHPDFRLKGIGHRLVEEGTADLISDGGPLNSVYGTTRTNSVSPQLTFLRNGFLPLGIFPNAHKLNDYETLTLFVKYRPGVLERRHYPREVHEKLLPMLGVLQNNFGIKYDVVAADVKPASAGIKTDFELIDAPKYVQRRFYERFANPYDRFYPFHSPNLMLCGIEQDIEIYAYLNHSDRYCTIVALSQPIFEIGASFPRVLTLLRDFGASYVETMLGLQHTKSIGTLVEQQFLPSAIYPACQESDGKLNDFVIMSRSMEPLDFRGMEIDIAFKPFIDQYITLWKKMHLETLEIFNETKPRFNT